MNFGDDSRFIENSALRGGGVFAWRESEVSFGDISIFFNNSVHNTVGGGVYVDGSTLSFGDDSTLSFGDDSTFIDNSAGDIGGGVSI